MNVLIACEESQAVCKEFRALGHNAYSCDILECSGVTHNSITKEMMLRVIWWLLNLAFDVPEGARGPEINV